MSATARVVVAGGGFAGLETAFLLRMRLGDHVDIDARVRPRRVRLPAEQHLHPVRRRPRVARWSSSTSRFGDATSRSCRGACSEVDPDARLGGARRRRRAPLRPPRDRDRRRHAAGRGAGPGRARRHDLDDRGDARRSGGRFEATSAGRARGRASARALPRAAEQQVLGAALRDRLHARDLAAARGCPRPVDITWSTYEQSFIQAFGPRLHDVVDRRVRRARHRRTHRARSSPRCGRARSATRTAHARASTS